MTKSKWDFNEVEQTVKSTSKKWHWDNKIKRGFLPLWILLHTSFVIGPYLFCSLVIPLHSEAYFQSWGTGAKPRSLGEAFTAKSGELESLLYNPAGLFGLTRPMVTGSYGALWTGLTDGTTVGEAHLAMGWPLWPQTGMAVGWQSRLSGGLFREDSVLVGIGFPSLWPDGGWWGVNLKGLRIEQTPNYATDNNTGIAALSAFAWTADLGVLYRLQSDLTLGVSILSITQPALSVVGESTAVPIGYRLGVSYHLTPDWEWLADGVYRNQDVEARLGMEHRPADWLALRAGAVATRPSSGKFSVEGLAGGLGTRWTVEGGELLFDYAIGWPLNGGPTSTGHHRASLTFAFSSPSPLVGEGRGEGTSLPLTTLAPVALLPPWTAYDALNTSPEQEFDLLRQEITATDQKLSRVHRAALAAVKLDRLDEARQLYEHLAQSKSKTMSSGYPLVAFHALGRLQYLSTTLLAPGEGVRALVPAYQEAIHQMGDEVPPDILRGLAIVLMDAHQWGDAAEAWTRWQSAASEIDAASQYNQAVAAVLSKHFADAERALQQLDSSGHQGWMVEEVRGRLALARDLPKPKEALIALERAHTLGLTASNRPDIFAHVTANLAVGRYQARQFEAALTALTEAAAIAQREQPLIHEQVASLRQGAAEAYLAQGNDLAVKEQDFIAARAKYESVFLFMPDHQVAKQRLLDLEKRLAQQIEEQKAKATKAENRFDLLGAIQAWKEILKSNPGDPDADNNIQRLRQPIISQAREAVGKQEWKEAYRLLSGLNEISPTDESRQQQQEIVQRFIGDAGQALQQEQYAKARDLWKDLLRIDPTLTAAQEGLAQAVDTGKKRAAVHLKRVKELMEEKDLKAARIAVQLALDGDPDHPDVKTWSAKVNEDIAKAIKQWSARANDLKSGGDLSQAVSYYRRVLDLDPANPEAKDNIRVLGNIAEAGLARLYKEAVQQEAELRPADALAKLDRLLKERPDHEEGKLLKTTILKRLESAKANQAGVKDLILQGDLLYGQGQLKNALVKWKDAASLDHYNTSLRKKIEDAEKESKQ